MSTNPFDREIRRKLENYESPVAPDMLDKVLRRRRRMFLGPYGKYLLIAAGLLLAGIAGWYGLYKMQQEQEKSPLPQQLPGSQASPEGIASARTAPADESFKKIDLQSSPESLSEILPKHARSSTSPQTAPTTTTSLSHSFLSSTADDVPAVAPTQQEDAHFEELSREEYVGDFGFLRNTFSEVPATFTSLDLDVQADAQAEKGQAEEPLASEGQWTTVFLPTAFLRELPEETARLHANLRMRAKPDCADFRNGNWQFFFDVTASPDFALRSIRPKDQQALPLALRRLETESVRQSYSVGTTFSAVSPKGWALRSGFEYTQINERFAYEGEKEERIIISIVYDDQGNIIGTDTTYESYTPYYASNNVYRLFDLPFMAGYQLDLKRFALVFQGGLYVNLFFSPEGTFFSPEMQPVSFEDVPAFRKRASLSMAASFGLNYRLNSRFHLIFEPKFRYFFEPITTRNYLLEQQYMVVGLNLGMRVKL